MFRDDINRCDKCDLTVVAVAASAANSISCTTAVTNRPSDNTAAAAAAVVSPMDRLTQFVTRSFSGLPNHSKTPLMSPSSFRCGRELSFDLPAPSSLRVARHTLHSADDRSTAGHNDYGSDDVDIESVSTGSISPSNTGVISEEENLSNHLSAFTNGNGT